MKMELDIWVENSENDNLRAAKLVVEDLEMKHNERVLDLKLQVQVGKEVYDYFTIDIEQLRIGLNAFSALESSILDKRSSAPR